MRFNSGGDGSQQRCALRFLRSSEQGRYEINHLADRLQFLETLADTATDRYVDRHASLKGRSVFIDL